MSVACYTVLDDRFVIKGTLYCMALYSILQFMSVCECSDEEVEKVISSISVACSAILDNRSVVKGKFL